MKIFKLAIHEPSSSIISSPAAKHTGFAWKRTGNICSSFYPFVRDIKKNHQTNHTVQLTFNVTVVQRKKTELTERNEVRRLCPTLFTHTPINCVLQTTQLLAISITITFIIALTDRPIDSKDLRFKCYYRSKFLFFLRNYVNH